jgi:hypothetical protein
MVGQAARNLRYVSPDTSAYGWNYQEISPSGLAGFSISNMRRFFWETFGQGVSAGTYVRYALGETLPRLEFFLSFAAEPLPLRGTVYGALEQRGMNLYGRSPRYGSTSFDRFTTVEYPNAGIVTYRLFGAEMEIKLFSLELQRSFSHFYFNRIFASLGWRGAWFDNQETATGDPMGEFRVVHSALFRLGTTLSAAPVTVLPVKLHPSFWAALRLSDLPEDMDFLKALYLGFSFSMTY